MIRKCSVSFAAARGPWIAGLVGALLSVAGGAHGFTDSEVRAIVANERPAAQFPDAGGVWMARQRVVDIDGVGNAVIVEHLLARVFDPAWGAARFAPHRRTYWAEFNALQVARAGVWSSRDQFAPLPQEAVQDQLNPAVGEVGSYSELRESTLAFPPLAAGEVVEIKLVWTCRIPPYDRNVRWLEETFGAEEPVVEQQLVLIMPAAASLDTLALGAPLHRQLRYVDGKREITWMSGNLPPVGGPFVETPWDRVPAAGVTLSPAASRLVYTSMTDWTWAGRFYGAQWEESWRQRSVEADRLATEFTQREPEPRARALAIERHVRDEVRTIAAADRQFGLWPFPASRVALERAGVGRDKSLFLVSLLRSAGLEAYPILVRERADAWADSLPSIAQLDRFIVRTRVPAGDTLWLDPIRRSVPVPAGKGLLFAGPRDPRPDWLGAGLVHFPGLPADEAGSPAGALE